MNPKHKSSAPALGVGVLAPARRLVTEVSAAATFVPNGAQERFIKMFAEGGYFDMVASFANGSGKTCLLANLLWNIVDGPQNQWFDYPLFRDWPYPRHLRLAVNAEQIKPYSGAVWQAIHQWWPKKQYTTRNQGFTHPALYVMGKKGFLIDVVTFGQPAQNWESVTLGGLFSDEEPPRNVWLPSAARFRFGGKRAIFATLLFDSVWVYEELMKQPTTGWFYADIEANCLTHGIRGRLKHEHVAQMIAAYPADERAARETGVPVHLARRVFHFNERHLTSLARVPAEGETLLVVDPHQLRPWVIVVGRRALDGNWYIIGEWPTEDYHQIDTGRNTLADYAAVIEACREQFNVGTMLIDTKFAHQRIVEDFDVTTLRDKLLNVYGLQFDAGDVRVTGELGGINVLKDLLGSENQPPRFFVADNCRNTIHQLKNLTRTKEVLQSGEAKLDTRYLDYPRGCMYLVMHDPYYRAKTFILSQAQRDRSSLQAIAEKTGREDLLALCYDEPGADLIVDEVSGELIDV